MTRFCESGSPPVTHTWRTPCFATSARIESISHHSPPKKAYVVSQYWQRSGQPVRRTNTVGQPTLRASPWTDRKISVRRSRVGAGVSIAVARDSAVFEVERTQAAVGQARGVAFGVALHHLLQRAR